MVPDAPLPPESPRSPDARAVRASERARAVRAARSRSRRAAPLPGAAGALALALVLPGCGGGGGGGASAGPLAELVPVGANASPSAVVPGGSLLVGDTLRNQGPGAAGSLRVGVYLSADAALDAGDRLLGSRTLAGLAPGAESTGGGSLQVPTDVPPGPYRVLVVADDLGQVPEGNEADNLLALPDPVQVDAVDLPDLAPLAVTVGATVVEAGQPVAVSDTVRNDGTQDAGSFRVGVYLSADDVLDAGDVLLGQRSLAGLDVDQEDVAADDLTVPAATPAGTYRVGVRVDDLEEVGESDEANNALLAAGTLTVLPAPLAQLVPDAVSFAPSTLDVGGTLLVSEAVRNAGSSAAGSFTVAVVLSPDPVLDDADTVIGTRLVPGLAPAETSAVSGAPLTVPSELAAGTWYVGLRVDPADQVPEADEADNHLLAAGTLTLTVPPLPDLVPTTLGFSPSTVDADLGESVSFDEGVRNDGVVAAGGFRVGLYLSVNGAFGPEDLLVASRTVSALDVAAVSAAGGSFTPPLGMQPGTYRLIVVADDEGALGEVSEGNNVLVSTATLDVVSSPDPLPDLVVEQVNATSSSVQVGSTLIVTTKVRNEGDLSAPPFAVAIYLSEDDVIEPSDHLLGVRQVGTPLGVGFATVASGPLTVPASLPAGPYRLGAIADEGGLVLESDEANNTLANGVFTQVTVPPPPAPDVHVDSFSIALTDVTPGAVLPVDDAITNTGDLPAGTFRVGVYLSDDADLDPAVDVLLGTRTVGGLAVGAQSASSWQVTVPAGTAPGTYRVGLVADDLQQVVENDEADNDELADDDLEVQ